MLKRFNMTEIRPVTTTLAGHFKLFSKQCSQSSEEEKAMSRVPYASAVGSVMYTIICTRPDLAYTVSIVSRVKSRKTTLESSEVGATISARKCETRLGVSEIENEKA